MGGQLSCRLLGALWLLRHRDDVDVVIDEVNTLPFLSSVVVPRKTRVLIHQLAREVWWYEAPRPLAMVGYALEPLMLRLYRRTPAITISNSSAQSLRAIGFRGPIDVIESPSLPPVDPANRPAFVPGRVGYVGRTAASKRIDDIIRAFALLADRDASCELWIVGTGSAQIESDLKNLARELGCLHRVRFTGFVSEQERDSIMGSLDCLVMASVREGWGLVVSEAARFGVPTVSYDSYGLRDAVVDEVTGLLVRPHTPAALASALDRILSDRKLRERLGAAASENLSRLSYDIFAKNVREFVRSGLEAAW